MDPIVPHTLRLADLPQGKATAIEIAPNGPELTALAERLGVDQIRKLRLTGQLRPGPGADWQFSGRLGASVVQPCRVTTDPVTTRLEEEVLRHYMANLPEPSGDEAEMPEDDTLEPLPELLDLGALLEEVLALAIPAFPRAEGVEDVNLMAAPDGAAPLDDEAVKPFAALAALKAKMEDPDAE